MRAAGHAPQPVPVTSRDNLAWVDSSLNASEGNLVADSRKKTKTRRKSSKKNPAAASAAQLLRAESGELLSGTEDSSRRGGNVVGASAAQLLRAESGEILH